MQLSAFAAARAKRKLVEIEVDQGVRPSGRVENQAASRNQEEPIECSPDILSSSTAIDIKPQYLESSEVSDTSEQLGQLDSVAKNNILSTWIPISTNYEKIDRETFRVRLEVDDTLCFVGEYHVQVLAGSISIYGAILEAGSGAHSVFAPSTHDLPLIECMSKYATVVFKSIDTGLRTLGRLSPLFSKIWNGKIGDGESAKSLDYTSFTYLQKVSDDTLKRAIRPMHLPESWNSALRVEFSSDEFGYRPISLVCGAKGSEKSTYARCLLNRLYSQISRADARQLSEYDVSGIIWIDLDPSQPEFTPPGQLSLVSVRASVFGPSFTHSAHQNNNNSTCTIEKAYAFGTLDCVEDAEQYLCCVEQTLEDFMHDYSVHPVVISLPTWAGFSGLHLLIDTVELIQKNVTDLSHVFYIGEPCPAQLRELFADKLYELTVPETGHFLRRTPAELRAMQTMSYFHSQPGSASSNGKSPLKWNSTPMTDLCPWVVSYSNKNSQSGVRAILQMAETHPSEVLSTALNGRIVSVAYLSTNISAITDSPPDNDKSADIEMKDINEKDSNTFSIPTILRTKSENIPYVNPDRTATFLDKHGVPHTLGHALIRAIDTQNQNFHLLTPVSAHVIRQALLNMSRTSSKGDSQIDDDDGNITSGLILTLGALDTPDWAYLENGYLADHTRQTQDVEQEEASRVEHDEDREEDITRMKRQKDFPLNSDTITKENSLDRHDYYTNRAANVPQRKFDHVPWVKEVDRSSRTGGGASGVSGLGTLKRRVRRI